MDDFTEEECRSTWPDRVSFRGAVEFKRREMEAAMKSQNSCYRSPGLQGGSVKGKIAKS